MLFHSGRRSLALKRFDVSRDRDGLDVFEILVTGAFTPGQELFDCSVIRGPCVGVADRGPCEELQADKLEIIKEHDRLVDGPAARKQLEKERPSLVAARDSAVVRQKRERLQARASRTQYPSKQFTAQMTIPAFLFLVLFPTPASAGEFRVLA